MYRTVCGGCDAGKFCPHAKIDFVWRFRVQAACSALYSTAAYKYILYTYITPSSFERMGRSIAATGTAPASAIPATTPAISTTPATPAAPPSIIGRQRLPIWIPIIAHGDAQPHAHQQQAKQPNHHRILAFIPQLRSSGARHLAFGRRDAVAMLLPPTF